MRLLSKGDTVTLLDGSVVTVNSEKPLGEGGQGIVYSVDWNGEEYALKWYNNKDFFKNESNDFYNNIYELSNGRPDWQDLLNMCAFPIQLTDAEDDGQFGYVMKLISPADYVSMNDITGGYVKFDDTENIIKACQAITTIFSHMNDYNLNFKDINPGCIYINPKNGDDIMICDCDNISCNTDYVLPSLGTPEYMAPELYKGGKCSEESDRHSLAVILFELIIRDKPFEGKKVKGIIDDKKRMETYANNPQFSMDPDDQSNILLNKHAIQNWEAIPQVVKKSFIKTLKKGLFNPDNRASVQEWLGDFVTWSKDPFKKKLKLEPVPPRIQQLLFVVDSSESMEGEKLSTVNRSIRDSLEYVKNLEDVENVRFRIGIIQFGDGCKWYSSKQSEWVRDFSFEDMKTMGTFTDFNLACRQLNNFLNSDFMEEKQNMPFILLISDGICEEKDYHDDLAVLNDNLNYKMTIRVAIGADDDETKASEQMLFDFTGNKKFIIKTELIEHKLGELIRNVTMRIVRVTTRANSPLSTRARAQEAIESLNL